MRKIVTLPFVLTLAMAVMAGCGGDGGGEVASVPQSSATYEGLGLPAVLDSTINTQGLGVGILTDLSPSVSQFGAGRLGNTSTGTGDSVQGGDGGSFTYSGSYSSTWDSTSGHSSLVQSLSFSDFADSRGVDINYSEGSGGRDVNALSGQSATRLASLSNHFSFSDVQAGRGTLYRSITEDLTTDGDLSASTRSGRLLMLGSAGPGPVGNILTDHLLAHVNFDSFYTSQGYANTGTYYNAREWQTLRSGFYSADNMAGPYNTTTGDIPFSDTISADYAKDYYSSQDAHYMTQTTVQYTQALLGFDQTHAWDLSTATLMSSGTYCAEGDVQSSVLRSNVLGCVDFDISVTWDHDGTTEYSCRTHPDLFSCYGWPGDGLVTLEAGGATASYAFTPTGGTFTFDAGNGSALFETNL